MVIGYWSLVSGEWSLVIGHWLLVIVFSFSLEKVVSIKLAIQFAVEETYLTGRFEYDAFHRGVIGRDDPSRSPGKLMLECRADSTIEVLHLFVTLQSLAIRRVEHHQRGSPTLGSSTDGHRQSDRAELFTRTREGA